MLPLAWAFGKLRVGRYVEKRLGTFASGED
jgi:hypothetical protein